MLTRIPLSLPRGSREAYASTGYTPFLAFTVGELQGTVQRLLALGATLDGPIKYSQGGKVAPVVQLHPATCWCGFHKQALPCGASHALPSIRAAEARG